MSDAFRDVTVNSIRFDENSGIKQIGLSVFYNSTIRHFYIPATLTNLNDGWCNSCKNLTKIEISPLNRNFKMIDDKFLFGKSDLKSDIFDVILFACRDIEKVDIPPYIKKISSSAFDHCQFLNSVNIPENSELRTISDYSFCETNLNQINITSNVVEIGKGAFEDCSFLKKLNLSANSKLRLIENSSFSSTSLSSFTIPEQVSFIDNYAFSYSDIHIFEFSEKSKLKFINKQAFIGVDAVIMIPFDLKNKISI